MPDLATNHVLAIAIAATYLLLVAAALIATIRDRTISWGVQAGWILLLILLPAVGLLAWAVCWLLRCHKATRALENRATAL
jgi:hypothetical protein